MVFSDQTKRLKPDSGLDFYLILTFNGYILLPFVSFWNYFYAIEIFNLK